jgi:beta-lactamase class A
VQRLAAEAGEGVEIGVAAHWVGTTRRWSLAGDDPFPAASTIKLAILVALFREVDAGRLDLNERLAVDAAAPVPGSGVLGWLSPGLSLSLADLAYLMIAVSDNTASNLLLEAVGMDRVGVTIADLGLRATALNRRFLGRAPDPGEPENVTSAADLVSLLTAIAEGTAATPTSCERMRALLALQQDRDRLARYLPSGVEFGGKSGTLPGLAHDAGLLSTPGGTLAIAVLTRGFSDPYLAEGTIGAMGVAMLDEG